MRRAVTLATLVLALGACGKLQGFGGPETPLVTFNLTFNGDLAPLVPAGAAPVRSLQVALVWGAQWFTEPLCILAPMPAEAAALNPVLAAGCRDALGFVPARVDQSAPIMLGQNASLPLYQLPSADLMVGDITARVAYGSLVVYDDRDGDNTLDLSQPHYTPAGGRGGDRFSAGGPDSMDVVYGASFVTMTAPDMRVAYREGGVPTGAFYPRQGCDGPDQGFDVLGADGFKMAEATLATLMGTLPTEDGGCSKARPSDTVVNIAAQAPKAIDEVGCDESETTGAPRYRQPPTDDLGEWEWGLPTAEGPSACGPARTCRRSTSPPARAPTGGSLSADGGASAASLIQLVISGPVTPNPDGGAPISVDQCKGLTHYVLRGCNETLTCGTPDWDFTTDTLKSIPWWPCPQ